MINNKWKQEAQYRIKFLEVLHIPKSITMLNGQIEEYKRIIQILWTHSCWITMRRGSSIRVAWDDPLSAPVTCLEENARVVPLFPLWQLSQ